MATVWVSGATGFVGQGVLRALIEAGHGVRALVHRGRLPRSFLSKGVTVVRGSVLDPATLESTMEECDAAIHLVGIIVEKRKASFYQIHYLGAVNAVEAARAAGVKRFLLMSALGAKSDAATPYFRTKWMAEEYLRSGDMDYTIMRPSIIFGKDDSFVNLLVRMTRYLPFVPVMGPGDGRLQPVWLEDVAACFVRALEKRESGGKTYDLGGPRQYTFNELLDAVAGLIGKKGRRVHVPLSVARPAAAVMELLLPKPPITRDQITMLEQSNICDISPMVNELGVEPSALEEAFLEYYGR
jgi:NADH dehydrogenase